MRVLYLVRHGHYEMEQDAPGYGALTALGRRQAVCVGRRLARLPFAVVHHSDLPRAVETARIIVQQIYAAQHHSPVWDALPIRATRLLREGIPSGPRHWGQLTHRQRSERTATKERMDRAFDKLFRPCRTAQRVELIVAHGNLIRYLVRRALGDNTAHWWRMNLNQCGLSVIAVDGAPRHSVLMSFNDTGHLPPNLLTQL